MTLFKITTLLRDFDQVHCYLHGKRVNEFYVIASSATQAVEQLVLEWNRLGLRHNGRADIIAINNLACRAEDQNAKYILVQQPAAQFTPEPFFPGDTNKRPYVEPSAPVVIFGRPSPRTEELLTEDQLREHFNRPGVLVTRNATEGVDVSKHFPLSLKKNEEE
jgi:hypothetical protein